MSTKCVLCVQQMEIDSIRMNLLAALQQGTATVTYTTTDVLHRQYQMESVNLHIYPS